MSDHEPTRIGLAITELDAGGAERAFVQLATGLDRSRWEPRVFCLSGHGELAATLEAAGIPVEFIEARGKFDLGVIDRLKRGLTQFRPAIVQTFLHHANIAGRIAARRAEVPVVVCGLRVAEERSRWRLRIDRWTGRSVSAWVCVSESVRQFSIKQGGLPAERLHVIPNGIDVERFRDATPLDWTTLGFTPESRIVLFVGRLDEQKRPLDVYDVCRELLLSRPDLGLVFAGIGPLRGEIERRAAANGLSSRVLCLGKRDDVPSLMRGASVLLHLSEWEGSPNVVREAVAAQLPVVASDVPGNREALGGGKWGILVPSQSLHAAAPALEVVLGDRADRHCFPEADYWKQFTWSGMVAAYEGLYRDLLARNA